ncbi:MAG: hypothetical protein FWB99_01495 [Treponema sp.]|nr:hypothetical protein [Treponema sp.]
MNPFSAGALSLRRRSVWEAADSGILLWRSSFIHFIPVFVLPVLLAAAGLRLLSGNSVFLSYFVIWWLKPLFDRLVLHVVSSRFFASETPSRFRGLWAMRRGLLGDLLWRRFSPLRAAGMPIRVLERLGGGQFRMRKKALAAGGLNFCSFISIFGLALEAVLLLGEVLFVTIVCQMFFPGALELMRNNMETVEIFIFAAFCINYILVGSLYVCMGFGLYINSRVEVEGWDLQLLFQKFAGSPPASRPGVKALFLLCLFLALPQTAYSDVEPPPQSLEVLESILASPDFGEFRDSWGIRFREREQGERAEQPELNFPPWLERMRLALSYLLRAVAVIAIAGFACFALYWYWKHRWKGLSVPRLNRGKNYTNPLFSAESPQALFTMAEDFFSRGNLREAWAACLGGCIGACVKYRSLSFPNDATEYGCLDLVRRSLPAEASGFAALVRSWILLAYGGRPPIEGAFEEALAYGRSLLNVPGGPDEA